MEFWNKIGELEVLNIKIGVVLRDLFEVMNRPLARNVIRDNNIADGEPSQYGCDNIICVYVPAQQSIHVYV